LDGVEPSLDVNQAIKLRNQLQTANFMPVQILGLEKGYVLSINALLVDTAILTVIEQFAEKHSLSLTLEQGYWIA
jgi:hypothetical protein